MDRMATEQAAARRVIDRLRAERAAAGDPLPAPQQREARIVDAVQAEPAPQQGDDISAAVARVLARHRAQAAAAAGTAPSNIQEKDELTVNERNNARTSNGGVSWSARQEELIRRRREAGEKATTKKTDTSEASTTSRRAGRSDDRNSGRSL